MASLDSAMHARQRFLIADMKRWILYCEKFHMQYNFEFLSGTRLHSTVSYPVVWCIPHVLYGAEIRAFGWPCETLCIKMAYGCFATHCISINKHTITPMMCVNMICVVNRLISDWQIIYWHYNIAHSHWVTHCHRCLLCVIRWQIRQFDQIVYIEKHGGDHVLSALSRYL